MQFLEPAEHVPYMFIQMQCTHASCVQWRHRAVDAAARSVILRWTKAPRNRASSPKKAGWRRRGDEAPALTRRKQRDQGQTRMLPRSASWRRRVVVPGPNPSLWQPHAITMSPWVYSTPLRQSRRRIALNCCSGTAATTCMIGGCRPWQIACSVPFVRVGS